jgi:hypothetical protein
VIQVKESNTFGIELETGEAMLPETAPRPIEGVFDLAARDTQPRPHRVRRREIRGKPARRGCVTGPGW